MKRAFKMIRYWFQNYNLENRAHKFLEKSKLPPAPKHESTERLSKQIGKDPEVSKAIENKDDILNERLKNVYVTSKDPDPKPELAAGERAKKSSRPLPQSRRSSPPQLGTGEETGVIPRGRLSIQQALDMIYQYSDRMDRGDDKKDLQTHFSKEYSLEPKDTANVFQHFLSFNIRRKRGEIPSPLRDLIDERGDLSEVRENLKRDTEKFLQYKAGHEKEDAAAREERRKHGTDVEPPPPRLSFGKSFKKK